MNTSEAIVKILEENNFKDIFGYPGEQILPLYKALKDSSIKHILMRHEQGAGHACDAYARSTGKIGVCIATGGPGALNLTMAVATAFKDSVPLLILTGDNPYIEREMNYFQATPINDIFKNITIKSFYPNSGDKAILNLKEALEIFKKQATGPIHINLSKDILLEEINKETFNKKIDFSPNYSYLEGKEGIKLLKKSNKPLIIAGSGIIWSNVVNEFQNFIKRNRIPIVTTYQARGIIDEKDYLNLGMVGIRGTTTANYGIKNSDFIIAIGTSLSERTLPSELYNKIKSKTFFVSVNCDKRKLKGNLKLYGELKAYINLFNTLILGIRNKSNKWIKEIYDNNELIEIEGINDKSLPLKPQSAINSILSKSKNSFIVNDAGTHTTWTTLLTKVDRFGKLVFSGGFGPMGYGLPGSIGVSIANPKDKVIVINGDGGFQMNIQELATLKEYNLNIIIVVLNNSELGIIRQWEEEIYNIDKYQVDLDNPDFVAIGKAYGIESERVESKEDLEITMNKAMKSKKPFLIEVIVSKENIPLPKNFI